MLVKINDGCMNCNYQDQNAIVDATLDPVSFYAAYYDTTGLLWMIPQGEYEILNVVPANVGDFNAQSY